MCIRDRVIIAVKGYTLFLKHPEFSLVTNGSSRTISGKGHLDEYYTSAKSGFTIKPKTLMAGLKPLYDLAVSKGKLGAHIAMSIENNNIGFTLSHRDIGEASAEIENVENINIDSRVAKIHSHPKALYEFVGMLSKCDMMTVKFDKSAIFLSANGKNFLANYIFPTIQFER